jgi:hypothetical protein
MGRVFLGLDRVCTTRFIRRLLLTNLHHFEAASRPPSAANRLNKIVHRDGTSCALANRQGCCPYNVQSPGPQNLQ